MFVFQTYTIYRYFLQIINTINYTYYQISRRCSHITITSLLFLPAKYDMCTLKHHVADTTTKQYNHERLWPVKDCLPTIRLQWLKNQIGRITIGNIARVIYSRLLGFVLGY